MILMMILKFTRLEACLLITKKHFIKFIIIDWFTITKAAVCVLGRVLHLADSGIDNPVLPYF